MCTSVYVHATCVQVSTEVEEDIRSAGASVAGGWESPDMGAGN